MNKKAIVLFLSLLFIWIFLIPISLIGRGFLLSFKDWKDGKVFYLPWTEQEEEGESSVFSIPYPKQQEYIDEYTIIKANQQKAIDEHYRIIYQGISWYKIQFKNAFTISGEEIKEIKQLAWILN